MHYYQPGGRDDALRADTGEAEPLLEKASRGDGEQADLGGVGPRCRS